MYKNLEKAMKEKDMTRTHLAAILGVDIKSITNKMSGATEWKWSEVKKIRELFPKYTLDWLFKEEKEKIA